MRIIVLGSAAGGGAPQWNCNGEVSRLLRSGAGGVRPRTQSSLAVSADDERWFLLNASPDLGEQIRATKALQPRRGVRHSPIEGVVLTNGDVDHVAGLLTLRESQKLMVYGTARVLDFLAENSIFNVLNPAFVKRSPITLDKPFALLDSAGRRSGLSVEAFSAPGKIALWLEGRGGGQKGAPGDGSPAGGGSPAGVVGDDEPVGGEEEDTIALTVRDDNGAVFHYAPACARMTDSLRRRWRGASLVMFDGTLWRDDEMQRSGAGAKTGQRMGHISNSGADGAMEAFAPLGVKRKIFIHINTTNPLLAPASAERREAEKRGWEVAYDGMDIRL